MEGLLRFSGSVKRDPAIDAWLNEQPRGLGSIARRWFARMSECGDDVRELMHNGCPVVCEQDAPFGYGKGLSSARKCRFLHWRSASRPHRPAGRRWKTHAPCEAEARPRARVRSAERTGRRRVIGYQGATGGWIADCTLAPVQTPSCRRRAPGSIYCDPRRVGQDVPVGLFVYWTTLSVRAQLLWQRTLGRGRWTGGGGDDRISTDGLARGEGSRRSDCPTGSVKMGRTAWFVVLVVLVVMAAEAPG